MRLVKKLLLQSLLAKEKQVWGTRGRSVALLYFPFLTEHQVPKARLANDRDCESLNVCVHVCVHMCVRVCVF